MSIYSLILLSLPFSLYLILPIYSQHHQIARSVRYTESRKVWSSSKFQVAIFEILSRTQRRINIVVDQPKTRMNRQRCIREVCRNSLAPRSRTFARSRPLFFRTRIVVQFYSTLKLSQTVMQSSETIPPSIPFDIQPLKVNSSPTPENVEVPLPCIPFPSSSVYFQYYAQRTSLDKAPELLYASSIGTANYQLSRMKGQVLGLDLEWRVQGPVNVSLVQICDEHKIILLHLATMKGFTTS